MSTGFWIGLGAFAYLVIGICFTAVMTYCDYEEFGGDAGIACVLTLFWPILMPFFLIAWLFQKFGELTLAWANALSDVIAKWRDNHGD